MKDSIAIEYDGQHGSEWFDEHELEHSLLHSPKEYPMQIQSQRVSNLMCLLICLKWLQTIQRPWLLYPSLLSLDEYDYEFEWVRMSLSMIDYLELQVDYEAILSA